MSGNVSSSDAPTSMERTLLERARRGDLKTHEAMVAAPGATRACIRRRWLKRVRFHFVLTGAGHLALDRPEVTP